MRRADVNARSVSAGIDVAWVTASTPPSLPGVSAVMLAVPGDFESLESTYRNFTTAGGPSAVRVDCNSVPLEPWALSPIPEFLERAEACLVLDLGDRQMAERWSSVVGLAREYPRLPILALGMPISPVLGKALDACPNLVVEVYDGMELRSLCSRYGAYRFAWGSAGRSLNDVPLDGRDLEQVVWTTAIELGEGRWGSAYL